MKKIILSIILALISLITVSAILFIAGSFANATFNIAEWPADSRGIVAALWGILSVILIIVVFNFGLVYFKDK
jgi:hypothetical protein